ncbi:hypothetical protein AAHA92_19012 [Salvia divinorum]|uniref:Uncharacterized protein n=1 Tax=Salvia divinorum TaxID=28513 RepID=A0ABD1H4C8_SALDI
MGETMSVNNVREGFVNNQVDKSAGGSRGASSKHKPDGTVALPKKKKLSWKSCHCFEWPSCCSKFLGCSCKCIRWPGWSGPLMAHLPWLLPCLKCRC